MFDPVDALKLLKAQGSLRADDGCFDGDIRPLSEHEVREAEARLGFKLSPLLYRLYTEISNGGFGYAYGFLGLSGGMLNEDKNDAVAQYLLYCQEDPDDPNWRWPKGLLPIGHLGCAMYHCVQCNDPDEPIVWFEPNPHEDGESWDSSFITFAPSLSAYIEAWLSRKDLFDVFLDGSP
jgi:SMI1 / KNR4 family (SUKH-1)